MTSTCSHCDWIGPRDRTHCPQCFHWLPPTRAANEERAPASAPANHTFKPDFYENISAEGMYIETRQQLRDECKKRGLISHQLEF